MIISPAYVSWLRKISVAVQMSLWSLFACICNAVPPLGGGCRGHEVDRSGITAQPGCLPRKGGARARLVVLGTPQGRLMRRNSKTTIVAIRRRDHDVSICRGSQLHRAFANQDIRRWNTRRRRACSLSVEIRSTMSRPNISGLRIFLWRRRTWSRAERVCAMTVPRQFASAVRVYMSLRWSLCL